jgi:hypothetical protein
MVISFQLTADRSRELQKTGYDAFEPELICHALNFTVVNLESLIFGHELWKKLSLAQGLPTAIHQLPDNPLEIFFSKIKSNFLLSPM